MRNKYGELRIVVSNVNAEDDMFLSALFTNEQINILQEFISKNCKLEHNTKFFEKNISIIVHDDSTEFSVVLLPRFDDGGDLYFETFHVNIDDEILHVYQIYVMLHAHNIIDLENSIYRYKEIPLGGE